MFPFPCFICFHSFFYGFCVFTFFCLCLFHVLIFSILILSICIFFLFLCVCLFIFFYFLFQKNSSFSNMFYDNVLKNKHLYFCLIRCRFEVWIKKTNLVFFFQLWFFFSFFCSLFCFLFFVIYFLIFF